MTSTGSASSSAWKTKPCSWTSARINGGFRSRAPSSPSCNIPHRGARAGVRASGCRLARCRREPLLRRGGEAVRPVPPRRPEPARNRHRPKLAAAGAQRPAGPLPPGSWQPLWTGQPTRLNRLERVDLLGLRALGPLAGRVLHPLVLLKAAVTVNLDGGVVNEDVIGAVVGGDETVPLVGVEPFHSALSHVPSPGGTILGTHVRAARAGAGRLPIRPG